MKKLLFTLCVSLIFQTTPAWAQNTLADLKAYLSVRDQIKTQDLAALKTTAANSKGKNVPGGLAAYYLFLKTPVPEGDVDAGKKAVVALENAADILLDPLCCVKVAQLYSRDNPTFGVNRDRLKTLKYLSIAWEIADLSDTATGDNGLLTLIINNTLGLGDGMYADGASEKLGWKGSLAAIRPAVLDGRDRFKKLYGLTVKDEYPGTTGLERHYSQ